MDRQHHRHDGHGFGFGHGFGSEPDAPADAARSQGTTANPKRWVIHARHGGGGTIASSSYGPHVTPDPGQ